MILVISNKNDLTTDFVVNKLNIQQIPFYRLNTEDLFNDVNLNFDFRNNKFEIIDNKLDITINLQKDITSVYYRRPVLPSLKNFNLQAKEECFITKELYYILNGIYSVLDNKFWINSPKFIQIAENKILQLQIAKQIGFNIPDTLLTNIQNQELNFVKNRHSIIKPVKTGLLNENEDSFDLIYTTRISELDIKGNNSQFPLYLQEEIIDKTDVRVTVIGERVFAVEIKYSNSNIVDWRNIDNQKINYSEIRLPFQTCKKCVQLVKSLNLTFGAIDLALDKNGNCFFFEINPNGQWAWLERILHLNIADETVNLLLKNGGICDK